MFINLGSVYGDMWVENKINFGELREVFLRE